MTSTTTSCEPAGNAMVHDRKAIPMTTHELKTLPEYFGPVSRGEKTFEIRKNDRDFRVGDTLILKEWTGDEYTGSEVEAEVTYVTDFAQGPWHVVMGIRLTAPAVAPASIPTMPPHKSTKERLYTLENTVRGMLSVLDTIANDTETGPGRIDALESLVAKLWNEAHEPPGTLPCGCDDRPAYIAPKATFDINIPGMRFTKDGDRIWSDAPAAPPRDDALRGSVETGEPAQPADAGGEDALIDHIAHDCLVPASVVRSVTVKAVELGLVPRREVVKVSGEDVTAAMAAYDTMPGDADFGDEVRAMLQCFAYRLNGGAK